MSTKRFAAFLLCIVLIYICGQFLIAWYATDDDDNGRVGAFPNFETGAIVREQIIPFNEMPEGSDGVKQLEGMEHGNVEYGFDFDVDRIERHISDPLKHAFENELPIMLWWTPFTGDMGSVKRCKEGSCLVSQNRSLFSQKLSQVMLFYGTDINESDLPLPRRAHHEWAVLHEESPKNLALFYHEEFLSLFNHTATFKQQSDYPLTTQYVRSINELLKEPVSSFAEKDELPLASTIYLQSGCNPPSDRDAYVNELMKFMKVDSYGACLRNKEMPENLKSPLTMHNEELKEFVGKYKFALTFENAICNDYITEKLWRPLAAGVVPVYKGAPNVKEWLPENASIILVDDFKHPRDLANYLTYVASNETEYNKYLNFKRNGITNKKLIARLQRREWGVDDFNKMSFVTGFECFVCDRVHKNRRELKETGEIRRFVANSNHYGCPRPQVFEYGSPPNTEDWERYSWQTEYDESKKRARELLSSFFEQKSNG